MTNEEAYQLIRNITVAHRSGTIDDLRECASKVIEQLDEYQICVIEYDAINTEDTELLVGLLLLSVFEYERVRIR